MSAEEKDGPSSLYSRLRAVVASARPSILELLMQGQLVDASAAITEHREEDGQPG